MSIKFLSKKQEQDIHVGLTKKIKFNRSQLKRWIRENPKHPDKSIVVSKKIARIKELEDLRKRFAIPYAYESYRGI